MLKRISLYYGKFRQQKLKEGVPEEEIPAEKEFCRIYLQEILDQGHIPEGFMQKLIDDYEINAQGKRWDGNEVLNDGGGNQ